MANKPRSGGPRTEAGKARSSQNARKHGLLTEKIFILTTEDPAEWQKLQDTWIAKLGPKDDLELLAVNRIAFAQWRMCRLWAIETAAIDKEMDDQFPAYEAKYGENGGDGFLRTLLGFEAFAAKEYGAGLMHRYQAHLEQCYARATKAFFDLRDKMKFPNQPVATDSVIDVPEPQTPVDARDAQPTSSEEDTAQAGLPNELTVAERQSAPACHERTGSPRLTAPRAEHHAAQAGLPNELAAAERHSESASDQPPGTPSRITDHSGPSRMPTSVIVQPVEATTTHASFLPCASGNGANLEPERAR